MSPSELLAITQPVHARAEISTQTVDGELRASRLPEAVVSGAMRRIASPQGLLARRTGPGATRRGPIDLLPAADRIAVARPAVAPIGMVAMTLAVAAQPQEAERPAVSAQSIQARLLVRLDPDTTVLERTKLRVAAPAGTWTRPDPLAPVATGLEFPDPMYDGLREVAPELLLPGLQNVEADSVALLETSPRVIEAYMVGLNHEMNRELLWREFPADLAGTPFRQFWDVRGQRGAPETLRDIPPHVDVGRNRPWHARPRLERGWSARAARAWRTAAPLPDDDDLCRARQRRRHARGGRRASRRCSAGSSHRTWCLPASRSPRKPRSAPIRPGPAGISRSRNTPASRASDSTKQAETDTPQSPNDLAWPHVPLSTSGHVDVSRPLAGAGADLQASWGRDAAGMAALTLQRPFRVAIHASRLIRVEPPR